MFPECLLRFTKSVQHGRTKRLFSQNGAKFNRKYHNVLIMRFKEENFQKIASQTTELSFAVSFPEFLTDVLFNKIKNESF